MIKDFIGRLTSRTFWVAVGTIIGLMAHKQYTEASSVAVAYILGEKAVDTFKNTTSTQVMPVDDESHNLDGSGIVTGSGLVKTDDEERPGLETGP